MERPDNYRLQAEQAKGYFLRYDQQLLIGKLKLPHDGSYLYAEMLCKLYRIHRATGELQRLEGKIWRQVESHSEIMTLLDLVCDSRQDRYLSFRWKQMSAFGLAFHQSILEDGREPLLELFREDPESLRRACTELKGVPMAGGDLSYAMELFDGLAIWLQIWEGDEEFPSRLRILWDENALMYLKYETMYYAVNLLRQRIMEMKRLYGSCRNTVRPNRCDSSLTF